MSDPEFDRALREAEEVLRTYLRARGLRATRQRDAVLREFLRTAGHVSAEELYERIRARHPSIGHATVYRCLNLFVSAGIASERRFHEGCVRYEPKISSRHHDHLVCLRCGSILEFEEPTIERLQEDIARSRGFRVQYHRLELYGVCADCHRGEAASGS